LPDLKPDDKSENEAHPYKPITRNKALTVRLPGARIAPASKTNADSQTGLENSEANARVMGSNSFGSKFIRMIRLMLS